MDENESQMKKTIVAASTNHTDDKYSLYDSVVEDAGLYDVIEAEREKSGKSKEDFLIVVKPNIAMMLRRDDIGTYTDSFIVIHALRQLLKKGYTNLAVVESQNLYGNWFENRAVVQTAARAGYFNENIIPEYNGESSWDIHVKGDGIDAYIPMIDLTLDMAEHAFCKHKVMIGNTWAKADFRLNISGMKAHFYSYYTMAIKNIYGCLPEQDKVRGYHCKRKVGPWTAELIRDFPVHFSVISGYSGADGWMGVKMKAIFAKPHTIIASSDIMAADHFGANFIGQKPEKSIMYTSLKSYLPVSEYEVKGNAALSIRWRNIPWVLPFASKLLEANANMMDFGGSIATGGNDNCFPLKNSSDGVMKKLLFLVSLPLAFICDIGIVTLILRKVAFYSKLTMIKNRISEIYNHKYILRRLKYFCRKDLEVVITLLKESFEGSMDFSGHYILCGDSERSFPSRFNPAVISAVEILNYTHRKNLKKDVIVKELQTLISLCPDLYDPAQHYAWCYR